MRQPTSEGESLLVRPQLIGALLALAAFALHSQALSHQFLLYDDNFFVWDNPIVRSGLNAHSLRWAFTETWGFWFPLTRLSHLLDSQLWGPRAGGHHLTNVLLHAGSTWLLFAALRRFTRTLWPAAAVAALFALHPLNVQAVAWISERKEVLCGFFSIAALWAYARYCERPGLGRMLGVTAFFACALMAKPMAVTLPAVMLLLDHWPLGRLWRDGRLAWRRVAEKLHLVAITGVFSALAHYAQSSINATADWQTFPLRMRLANAVVSYARYLGKLLWPTQLAAFYPHPYSKLPAWQVAGAATLLAAVTIAVVLLRRGRPHLLVGWLWWLGTFVPVIGLVQIGRQGMADHYAYLPSIGLFLAAVFEAARLPLGVAQRRWLAAGAAAVLLALGLLTLRQHTFWHDTTTLFEHAREVTGPNWLAESTLAAVREREGALAEAEPLYQAAIADLDEDAEIRSNTRLQLARLELRLGHEDAAIDQLERAIAEGSRKDEAHLTLGYALGQRGDHARAIAEYQQVLAHSPQDASAHRGLARVLGAAGRWPEAIEQLDATARLRPRDASVQYDRGVVYTRLDKPAEAAAAFRRALALKPDFAQARTALAETEAKLRAGAPPP